MRQLWWKGGAKKDGASTGGAYKHHGIEPDSPGALTGVGCCFGAAPVRSPAKKARFKRTSKTPGKRGKSKKVGVWRSYSDPIPGPSGETIGTQGASWPPTVTEYIRVKAPKAVGVAKKLNHIQRYPEKDRGTIE